MATLFSEQGNSLSYFAIDGSYGDAEGMVVADTSDWTNEMWIFISEVSDYDRGYVAECFENGVPIADVTAMLEDEEDRIFRPAP